MRLKKPLAMKIAASLMLIILLTGCGSDDTGRQISLKNKPIRSEWGKPYKGIRAMLYTPKSDWKVGDEIEIRLKLKNTTKRDYFFKNPYKGLYIAHNGEIYAEPIGEDSEDPIEALIKPGKTVEFDLTSISTDRKSGKGAGVYSIGGGLERLQLPELKVPVK